MRAVAYKNLNADFLCRIQIRKLTNYPSTIYKYASKVFTGTSILGIIYTYIQCIYFSVKNRPLWVTGLENFQNLN